MNNQQRVVCRFSCGAASAVATKLALAWWGESCDVQIINAFIKEEHEDNRRFLADCERWFGRSITVLRDEKYGASVLEVFRQRRYMKGPAGAPCSKYLKRAVLDKFNRPGDMMVFGFTYDEVDRYVDFKDRNPQLDVVAPLISRKLKKADCLAMVEQAGIQLPILYRMGYANGNCLCCVKGGEGYHRAMRADFPDAAEALAVVQDNIGPGAYLFRNRKTGERYSLRDIPPGPERRDGDLPECSFYCASAEAEL